jgi:hypothetical protein
LNEVPSSSYPEIFQESQRHKHKKREGNGKKKRKTCACHENKKENTSRNMATLETLVSMQEQNIKHMKINIGT